MAMAAYDYETLLRRTLEIAQGYLESLPERPVGRPVDLDALRAALGGPLPEAGDDAVRVVETLAERAGPGIVASAGPRYFGFVTGGNLPASLGTDWLMSAWDQCAGLGVISPAAAVVEEIAGQWLVELLGLPQGAGVGFTTGATTANFTGLAAGRQAVLGRVGWDAEADGLFGAPPVRVIVGEEAHASVFAVLKMLGLGRERVTRVAADGQGRMRADGLREALGGGDAPTIVCAQAGNVNTGAFDPLQPIGEAAREHGAWLHVDGAFGLWAAASPQLRHHLQGVTLASSWATDGHKWLNVPYDCGLIFVADAEMHRGSMIAQAPYLTPAKPGHRDPLDWVPDSSRRARGFPVYAALRALGRRGVAELVERCCALTRRMAERLASEPGVRILNDVVLNQALVRFAPRAGDEGTPTEADAFTDAVIRAVQRDGTCWMGGTRWHDMTAMRVSISNWSTTEADAERSAEAVLRCVRALRQGNADRV